MSRIPEGTTWQVHVVMSQGDELLNENQTKKVVKQWCDSCGVSCATTRYLDIARYHVQGGFLSTCRHFDERRGHLPDGAVTRVFLSFQTERVIRRVRWFLKNLNPRDWNLRDSNDSPPDAYLFLFEWNFPTDLEAGGVPLGQTTDPTRGRTGGECKVPRTFVPDFLSFSSCFPSSYKKHTRTTRTDMFTAVVNRFLSEFLLFSSRDRKTFANCKVVSRRVGVWRGTSQSRVLTFSSGRRRKTAKTKIIINASRKNQ